MRITVLDSNYYLQYSVIICHLYDSLCNGPDKIYWLTRRKYKHHSNHMRKLLKCQHICLTSNVRDWLAETITLLVTIVIKWKLSEFGDIKIPPCSFISTIYPKYFKGENFCCWVKFPLLRIFHSKFLNQALQLACAWFLDIVSVQDLCVCLFMYPEGTITTHMKWSCNNWLNKFCYFSISLYCTCNQCYDLVLP